MKMLFAFLLVLGTASLPQSLAAQESHELEIIITNVKPGDDELEVLLFHESVDWLRLPYRSETIPKRNGQTDYRMVFHDLPAGEYAFVVVDDTNHNFRLDTTYAAHPLEGYAFSNNAKPSTIQPPGYPACRFELREDVSQTLIMLYF